MMELTGLSGAPGAVAGTAVLLRPRRPDPPRRSVAAPQLEVAELRQARQQFMDHFADLAVQAQTEGSDESAAIFEGFHTILSDDYFFEQVEHLILSDAVCASYALEQKRRELAAYFGGMDDPYLQARAADISSICYELIAWLQGEDPVDPCAGIAGDRLVLFGEDLSPASTMRLDRARLGGIVTEKGGVTSHTAILAKGLGIPAVVGVGPLPLLLKNGVPVLVDGDGGRVVLAPDGPCLAAFARRQQAALDRAALFDGCALRPAVTADGHPLRVELNSGDPAGIAAFDPTGCDGIGLYRTEFLYMNRTAPPSEEVQFEAYRAAAVRAKGKEVIIRTLDAGGDKPLPYLHLPHEANPFLGCRALRLCLDRPDLFKVQLRAILRAGAYGDVKIMFPMVVSLEELEAAQALLEEAKAELRAEKVPHRDNLPVGIMVETPAAVLLSDQFARHVSFFSIGSNDLIQYLTATDRTGEGPQTHHDGSTPSFLRSVDLLCRNAHAQGVSVAICGETASEPRLIPLFCAMGVDALSVAPGLVGRTKHIITQVSRHALQEDLAAILAEGTVAAIQTRLDGILAGLDP